MPALKLRFSNLLATCYFWSGAGLLALVLGLLALPAGASGFDIQPIRLDLTPAQPISVVTLSNRGQEPVVIETRQVDWSQVDGRSEFVDSQDLVVSPPIFELAPGAQQTVRVGLRNQPDPSREGTYRIFFTEIPQAETTGSGLVMNLSLAIPVFVPPAEELDPGLKWDFEALGGHQLKVKLENPGNTHVQVKRLILEDRGIQVGESSALGYLLAGQRRDWVIDLATSTDGGELPQTLKIEALTDRGTETFEAVVAQH